MDDPLFAEQPEFTDAPVQPRQRKKRERRVKREVMPRNVTIPLEMALEVTAKLHEQDGMLLLEIVRLLNTTAKRSRRRIVQALGQLFK